MDGATAVDYDAVASSPLGQGEVTTTTKGTAEAPPLPAGGSAPSNNTGPHLPGIHPPRRMSNGISPVAAPAVPTTNGPPPAGHFIHPPALQGCIPSITSPGAGAANGPISIPIHGSSSNISTTAPTPTIQLHDYGAPPSSNCFLLYRQDNLPEIMRLLPHAPSLPPHILSALLAKLWASETDEVKAWYKRLADDNKGWAEERKRLIAAAVAAARRKEEEEAKLAHLRRQQQERHRLRQAEALREHQHRLLLHAQQAYAAQQQRQQLEQQHEASPTMYAATGGSSYLPHGKRTSRRTANSASTHLQPYPQAPPRREEDPARVQRRRNAEICARYYQQLQFDIAYL